MARATILSSLGAGLYRVRLHFDNSRIEARLTHMATQIANYTAELAALEPDKTTKTAALNTALTALNDYINATDPSVYVADPTELNALNKATWTARAALDVVLHDEKLLKLKKAALEKETALLNSLCPSDFETNAWCVAYNESLNGETEAIECDYLLWRDTGDNQIEHDTGVWLPALRSTPTNALIHPLASSEHATWFNLCMAPAAQRHAGHYRIATISNLNKAASTCDIALEGRYSVTRANGNVIDDEAIYPQIDDIQRATYAGATIVYGDCNGNAFENGDRVIVDLHGGTAAPTVIGFYSNPRACPVDPEAPPTAPGYSEAVTRTHDWTIDGGSVIDGAITGATMHLSVWVRNADSELLAQLTKDYALPPHLTATSPAATFGPVLASWGGVASHVAGYFQLRVAIINAGAGEGSYIWDPIIYDELLPVISNPTSNGGYNYDTLQGGMTDYSRGTMTYAEV